MRILIINNFSVLIYVVSLCKFGIVITGREIMKQVQGIFLGLIVMLFSMCSKDKDNDDEVIPEGDKDTVMLDILTEVAINQNTFMDIRPIPIQEELYSYAELDTSFNTALDVMESFNNMIKNPGVLLGSSLKSTQSVGWEKKGCEDIGGITECTWELDCGDYIYRVVQTISFYSNILETYISGTYDDVFYGELGEDFYLISVWSTAYDELITTIEIFFAPTHDGVNGERVFSYLYAVGEGYSVYSAGGSSYVMDVVIENIIYTWDGINGHHESISTVLTWQGSILATVVNTWCTSYESLRPFYASTYNFDEHEGAWCVFDCDGLPIYCSDN
jgi:hypothetical protein